MYNKDNTSKLTAIRDWVCWEDMKCLRAYLLVERFKKMSPKYNCVAKEDVQKVDTCSFRNKLFLYYTPCGLLCEDL